MDSLGSGIRQQVDPMRDKVEHDHHFSRADMPRSKVCNTIHVGIHKTATTFMQKHFFPSLTGITYLSLRDKHGGFLQYLRNTDDFDFDASKARDLFYKVSQSAETSAAILVSHEGFCGSPWDGAALRKRNCDRLAATFPEARIVVVLRNQRALLQSLYLQYIKTGGSAHWREFLTANRHPLINSASYYRFGEYVQYLFNLFGKEQVDILLYEDFLQDPADWLTKWCNLLDIPEDSWNPNILLQRQRENLSLSPRLVSIMRYSNKLTTSLRQPYLLLPRAVHVFMRRFLVRCSGRLSKTRARKCIPDDEAENFLRNCHDSNRLLEQLIGRSLRGLGYPGVD